MDWAGFSTALSSQYPWFSTMAFSLMASTECGWMLLLIEWNAPTKLQKNFNVKILSKIRNQLKWSFWFNNTIIKYECVGMLYTLKRAPRIWVLSLRHFQTNFVALKLLFRRLSNIHTHNFAFFLDFFLSSSPFCLLVVCSLAKQKCSSEALCIFVAIVIVAEWSQKVIAICVVVAVGAAAAGTWHTHIYSGTPKRDLQFWCLAFETKFQFDF